MITIRYADYLKPLPRDWHSMNKGELADARLGDVTYDCALPQQWLDLYVAKWGLNEDMSQRMYEKCVCECVTAYPPQAKYFGEVVNLITGDILTLN